MQLEEKRRHIEAEKYRAQAEWEDQRRRLGQTAFWYVMGKAQGSPKVGEGTGLEVRNLVAIVSLLVSYLKKKTMVLIANKKKRVHSAANAALICFSLAS